jgi:hypothetical protein
MKLTICLIFLSQSILATGLSRDESTPTPEIIKLTKSPGASSILRELTNYLNPIETEAFSSSHRDLEAWSRKLFINQITAHKPLDRFSSRKLINSPTLRAKIEEHFLNVSIYPLSLTFHQDDVPSLKGLGVLNFITRVHTVVFEGTEQLVIEANPSELGALDLLNGAIQWDIGMYEPNFWAWILPTSFKGILESETVTVRSLNLEQEIAELVIELSRFVTDGDINWTVKKTSPVKHVPRDGLSAEEILTHQKLRIIQTLRLPEFDRSVLVNVSVLANLESLQSLDLSFTNVVDVSALVKLTNLKSLNMTRAELLDVSTLPELKNLESLDLSRTKVVDISALSKLTNLKSLRLSQARLLDFSTLPEFENLESLDLSVTNVMDFSALAKLKKLESLDLSFTNVVDISGLAQLTNLKSLDLAYAKLLDISTFPDLKNLKSLNLRRTNFADVSSLKNKLQSSVQVRYY